MAKKNTNTISITMNALTRAAQFLTVLGNLKKEGVVALDISNYRIEHVDAKIKNFSEAESAVFKNRGIEADENGAVSVARDDERYADVVADLEALRSSRVEIPVFPVSLERLVQSTDKFNDNPISENILVELNVLFTGTPEETVH